MRLSRKPTSRRFFELFSEIGSNIAASVDVLREFVRAPDERRAELAERLHELEHVGDRATHAIIEHLDRSFVTPFDREDIYRLAVRLDDVVDDIDAAVDLTMLYRVDVLPEGVDAQVELLSRAAQLTAEALPRLADPQGLTDYWVEINSLENEADKAYRRLLSRLYDGRLEALEVMKLKEIVDQLEAAADAFEHVADVVRTIAVKES
ncbi:DUF47 domain-containing protein [Crossiella cryophila]|uniref:Putative phosphate transport protein (TIGR00153 family) n=1 Tax=Crossiella cryophila TaxID=43355 RepID=A0A7W7CH30_9PSEU|nr:DUF47 family protein [Crossiella cryophila]MBB4679638.1 putative phosphate transport protein (TIGR00153 family) [Crossiella cryophila]